MAIKTKIVFEGKKGEQWLSVKRENITRGYDKWTQEELSDLRDIMVRKIRGFSGRSNGELELSLIIAQQFKTDNKVSWSLFTEAKQALTNEYGIRPRWVTVKDKPQLEEWCNRKLGFVPRMLQIGTRRGRIPQGASKNKFFYNSIDEYISTNFSRRIGRELSKAINK